MNNEENIVKEEFFIDYSSILTDLTDTPTVLFINFIYDNR